MQKAQPRFGLLEIATLVGFLVVAAIVGVALSKGWVTAIIPGVTYILAMTAVYLIQRRAQAERVSSAQSRAVQQPAAALGELRPVVLSARAAPLAFRVVDTRGVCPLGYKKGAVVMMTSGGSVHPPLCAAAETVLRMAAKEDPSKTSDWCCPMYEHLLVFRREAQAA